jgi:hypothetical protein
MLEANGSVLLLANGQSEVFNPSLTVTSIVNLTTKGYCISGNPFSYIRSGTVDNTPRTVYGATPGPVCPL